MNPHQHVDDGPEPNADGPEDFLEYLARRLGVEQAVARARLSDWLCHYDPGAKPGLRKINPPPHSEVRASASDAGEVEPRRADFRV